MLSQNKNAIEIVRDFMNAAALRREIDRADESLRTSEREKAALQGELTGVRREKSQLEEKAAKLESDLALLKEQRNPTPLRSTKARTDFDVWKL